MQAHFGALLKKADGWWWLETKGSEGVSDHSACGRVKGWSETSCRTLGVDQWIIHVTSSLFTRGHYARDTWWFDIRGLCKFASVWCPNFWMPRFVTSTSCCVGWRGDPGGLTYWCSLKNLKNLTRAEGELAHIEHWWKECEKKIKEAWKKSQQ